MVDAPADLAELGRRRSASRACNEWLSGVPMTQVDLLHGFDDESLAEDERVALAHAAVVGLTEALAGEWVSDAELDSALLDAPKL